MLAVDHQELGVMQSLKRCLKSVEARLLQAAVEE